MAGYNNFEKGTKKVKNPNPFETTQNFSKKEENTLGNKKFMDKVKLWTSFYRQYPYVCSRLYWITVENIPKNFIILYVSFLFLHVYCGEGSFEDMDDQCILCL
jgi:hypothetical protein